MEKHGRGTWKVQEEETLNHKHSTNQITEPVQEFTGLMGMFHQTGLQLTDWKSMMCYWEIEHKLGGVWRCVCTERSDEEIKTTKWRNMQSSVQRDEDGAVVSPAAAIKSSFLCLW